MMKHSNRCALRSLAVQKTDLIFTIYLTASEFENLKFINICCSDVSYELSSL